MESKKSLMILCVVMGTGGIHRFYVGKWKSGLLYLFTGGILGIGYIADIIAMLNGRFTDKYGFVLQ